MKSNRLFLLLMIFIFGSSHLFAADDIVASFKKGNGYYRSGNYEEAIKAYESVIHSGNHSAALYYNLGNAYYKTGDVSHAILNFEKALRLNPGDDDIAYNLKLAYARTIDKIEPVPVLFYERWINLLLTRLSPAQWSWLAIALLWIALALSVWYLYASTSDAKRRSFTIACITVLLSFSFFGMASCADKNLNGKNVAIIMDDSAYIKSSPSASGTNLFMLHAGTRVEVISKNASWCQIRIANGNTGWVEGTRIGLI